MITLCFRTILDYFTTLVVAILDTLHFVCGLFWTFSPRQRAILDAYTLFAEYYGLFYHVSVPLWMLTLSLRTIMYYLTSSTVPLWLLTLLLADYYGLFHLVSGPFWILITLFADNS